MGESKILSKSYAKNITTSPTSANIPANTETEVNLLSGYSLEDLNFIHVAVVDNNYVRAEGLMGRNPLNGKFDGVIVGHMGTDYYHAVIKQKSNTKVSIEHNFPNALGIMVRGIRF